MTYDIRHMIWGPAIKLGGKFEIYDFAQVLSIFQFAKFYSWTGILNPDKSSKRALNHLSYIVYCMSYVKNIIKHNLLFNISKSTIHQQHV
jgi:hypothetical protein